MHSRMTLVGRVGRDPETRYTPDGTPVVNLSVAEDRGFGDRKTTVWWRVACWRKTAETVQSYVHKGDLLLFEGRVLEPRVYTGRDGQQRASLEMNAEYMRILQSRRPDDAPSAAPQQATAAARPQATATVAAETEEDGLAFDGVDEIPF
jgi:single-strand DNA-binding protein